MTSAPALFLEKNSWALVYYAATTAITFALYAWDKHAAQQGAGRIRERTLHAGALLGGFVGAFIGRSLLRHKSQSPSFAVVAWLALVAHLAGWIGWFAR